MKLARTFASILSLLLLLTVPALASTCVGADPCHACKNCHYCKHCAKEGGTCGVCSRLHKQGYYIYTKDGRQLSTPPSHRTSSSHKPKTKPSTVHK